MSWPSESNDDGHEAWVFGYGSLMWDPGFAYVEQRRALLHGYHRSLCILSIRNRGTVERPGLALGLDRGGSCRGFAFRIAAPSLPAVKRYLWDREMSHGVYQPKTLGVRLEGDIRVPALVFVARPDHAQYAALAPEKAAALVAQGSGEYGRAIDYLRNVVRHLDDFGIADCPLHRVLSLAEGLAAESEGAGQ